MNSLLKKKKEERKTIQVNPSIMVKNTSFNPNNSGKLNTKSQIINQCKDAVKKKKCNNCNQILSKSFYFLVNEDITCVCEACRFSLENFSYPAKLVIKDKIENEEDFKFILEYIK